MAFLSHCRLGTAPGPHCRSPEGGGHILICYQAAQRPGEPPVVLCVPLAVHPLLVGEGSGDQRRSNRQPRSPEGKWFSVMFCCGSTSILVFCVLFTLSPHRSPLASLLFRFILVDSLLSISVHFSGFSLYLRILPLLAFCLLMFRLVCVCVCE